jgi:MFS transporter, MHS family, proline/betaine transporter
VEGVLCQVATNSTTPAVASSESVPAYLCERFPTKRRAAGVGFGYSSGALLGAWFSAYVWWAHKIPFISAIEKQDMWLSPAVILTIGAAMTFISMWFSPETKHLQLDEVGEKERAFEAAQAATAAVPLAS